MRFRQNPAGNHPAGKDPLNGVVEVYSIALHADDAKLDECLEQLSSEERLRAGRFRHLADRRRFIVCRAALREILAGYLNATPGEVRFEYNFYGKPSVEGSDLCFNLSNSHDWAMLAVTRGREVGIDLEGIDARFVREQIPERFFSPAEVQCLRSLPVELQTEAFFRCWTRKEAYIKAQGMGMTIPLDSFDVSLAPNEPAALLRGDGNYTLRELPAPPGFQAAICAEGLNWSVTLRGAPAREFARRAA